jgi:oligopeptide transport system permease protein
VSGEPSSAPGAPNPPQPRKGVSLWADAWMRLRKNKMAMVGLVVVVVMSLSALFAPWLSSFDPTYKYTWIGAQPAGFEHPDVSGRSLLRVGSPAEVRPRYADAQRLVFESRAYQDARVRVVVKRGKIDSLQLIRGGERVDELIVTGEDQYLIEEVLDDDGTTRNLEPRQELELHRRQALPEAFGSRARNEVLILIRRTYLTDAQRYEATLEDGVVTSLTLDGEPVEGGEVDLRGRYVTRVLADGEEQVANHLLGTDLSGRDLYARVLYGGRISLLVGLIATLVSLIIGVVYGAVSGYAGGRVDAFLMAVVDVLYGIPYMFLVILLLVNFGRDIKILFIALGAVQWLTMARIVRGQVLSLKQKEFVEAAIMSGTGPRGILFGHLIPNTLGIVIVYTTLTVPAVILQESFLAFIGLAVEYDGKPLASWGALVQQGSVALGNDGSRSWLLLFPSLAMAATLFSLNFLGDGLRDALDPQQRGRT